VTQLDFIGIVVEDMAAALAFYRRLGLEIPEGVESEDHVECQLPNGLRLGWDTAELMRQIDPSWTKPSGSARIGLAFLCESPQAVDEAYAAIVAAGYQGHKEPWDAFWGQRYAQVLDPDGNDVSLFAPL
jgi:catechol 2,3-dioxygenase-like lactoylglutathione lyase family enzyme